MRITKETLLKIAQDTALQRTQADRDLLAVYMHGSLLAGDPILGGTADIDLFFVHLSNITEEREVVRLTDDVHLDITHHPRSAYRQTRELRLNPWDGPTIYDARILYDPQHYMDFIQASVRGQFNSPENIIARAQAQSDEARRIWLRLQDSRGEDGIVETQSYLKAVSAAANAITGLSGCPLPTRRFLSGFPERAEAVGYPGMYKGLLGLLGGTNIDAKTLETWVACWHSAFMEIPSDKRPVALHLHRHNYFYRAFIAFLHGDRYLDLLWPLTKTWTDIVTLMPEDSEHSLAYHEAMQHLHLQGEGFAGRVTALDAFLDTVEETLEIWGKRIGA